MSQLWQKQNTFTQPMEVEAYLSLFRHEGSLGESCYQNLENVKVALIEEQ